MKLAAFLASVILQKNASATQVGEEQIVALQIYVRSTFQISEGYHQNKAASWGGFVVGGGDSGTNEKEV